MFGAQRQSFAISSDWLKMLLKSRLGSKTRRPMASLRPNPHEARLLLCIFSFVVTSLETSLLAYSVHSTIACVFRVAVSAGEPQKHPYYVRRQSSVE